MKKPEGPCLGCKQRVPENPEQGTKDCHGSCKVYEKYKADLDEYKKAQLDERHKRQLGERPWMKRLNKKKAVSAIHD